jgi:hypothetical protein
VPVLHDPEVEAGRVGQKFGKVEELCTKELL